MIQDLIRCSGVAQVLLVLGSLVIPKMLRWKTELAKTNLLIRQMFWTYAGYILATNLSFGVLSLIAAEELLGKTLLAQSITLFISLYWIARIAIQFFYFDTSSAPSGWLYKMGEYILVALFAFLSFVYSWAFITNIS